MLKNLYIENIALIDKLDIDFHAGLNVLSGETGAGKSIIIDSLNLILGERAAKELIKAGSDKARVEAIFDISDHKNMHQILSDVEIDINDDDVVVTRELDVNGKNVCRVNGSLVNLASLKKITEKLVDIHGQHEHQSLLAPKQHIGFLDLYGKNNVTDLLDKIEKLYYEHKEVTAQIDNLGGDEHQRQRSMDLLQYQIDEINNAELKEDEEETLFEQKRVLQSSEKIMKSFENSYNILHGYDYGLIDKLKETVNSIEGVADLDEQYAKLAQSLNEAYFIIEECGIDIRNIKEDFSYDPQDIIEIDRRINEINDLKRKYGDSIPKILEFLEISQKERTRLENCEQDLELLSEKKQNIIEELYSASLTLSNQRRENAKEFEKEIIANLTDLGMKSVDFEVLFDETPTKEQAVYTKKGFDNLEFFITTNLGQPKKALSKVASGGEMSRIMLAFKNIIGDNDVILTNVFDEIDTGISGKIANVVAEKLFSIAKKRQVICVSHLSQIAAFANQNYLIYKYEIDGKTTTMMKKLNYEQKVNEVARLAGGFESKTSVKYAKELIEKAKN